MTWRNLDAQLLPKLSLTFTSRGANANGTAVDTKDFDDALVMITTSAMGSAASTITIEGSADGSTFAAIPGAATTALPATAGQVYVARIRLRGRQRYLRAVYNHNGGVGNNAVGVHFILGCVDASVDASINFQFEIG